MSDQSFLNWPFFDDRHRALSAALEAWASAHLPVDHSDVDAACKGLVAVLGEAGFLRHSGAQEGEVLDVLVQKRRNKAAALKLLRKLLKNQQCVPDEIVTDGLASYKAALKVLGCRDRHRPGRLRDKEVSV